MKESKQEHLKFTVLSGGLETDESQDREQRLGKMETNIGHQFRDRYRLHIRTGIASACEPSLPGAAQTPSAPTAADLGHLPTVHAAPGAQRAVQEEPGHSAAVWGTWWPWGDPAAEAAGAAGEDSKLGKSYWEKVDRVDKGSMTGRREADMETEGFG